MTKRKTAGVKAWAVVDSEGRFDLENVFAMKSDAESWCGYPIGERVIPVLITPIEEEMRRSKESVEPAEESTE